MIGEIKKVDIEGKEYELKKQGVNFSLTVQSIFFELILKSRKDIPDDQIESAMACGMRGPILKDIENVIKQGVFSPKITDYDEMPLKHIPKLLFQIYMFQVGDAEKKTENVSKSSDNLKTSEPL